MDEENISQEFRLKIIDETGNYLIEEVNWNELMSKKHKKNTLLLYFLLTEHFLTLASTITGCVFISTFASFIGIPIGITSSSIGLKIYAITTGIKK